MKNVCMLLSKINQKSIENLQKKTKQNKLQMRYVCSAKKHNQKSFHCNEICRSRCLEILPILLLVYPRVFTVAAGRGGQRLLVSADEPVRGLGILLFHVDHARLHQVSHNIMC